jgi:2-iminobutanoate/2-iminopropanoate deaminase
VTAPISQAVRVGDLVFVSGQVAMDPSTGQFTGGDAGAQTHQVLKNLAEVLEDAGSSLAEVTKVTAFLTDMGDFDAFNDAYREHFRGTWPARSTVQVARLVGPYEVEIEAIAMIGSAPDA